VNYAELIICVIECRESHKLMMHAASKGVHDAQRAVQDLCSKGRCPWLTLLHWDALLSLNLLTVTHI